MFALPKPRLTAARAAVRYHSLLSAQALFLLASVGYYFQNRELELLPVEWEYPVSEWGVRCAYGVGSALFVAASCLGLVEILVFVD